MSVTVIIADDHRIVREGLRSLLDKEPDIEVIAEAENGQAAVKLAQSLKPQVVVMDLTMPGLNGIEATRQILTKDPQVKVLALSMHSDKRFVAGALDAGVSGYLLKDCASEELVRALRTVIVDQTYLSPAIADIVVEGYVHHLPTTESSAVFLLTPREREVLQLITEGKTTREIASTLYMSVKTAETHRREIMRKLNIYNVADLTKYAIREGLTSIES